MNLDPEGPITQLTTLRDDVPVNAKIYEQVTPQAANLVRASFTIDAITAYTVTTCHTALSGEPLEQQIRDLLSDLMHLCDLFVDAPDADQTGYTFDDLLDNARRRYYEETQEVC